MKPQHRKDPATGRTVTVGALSASSVLKIHRVLSRSLKVAVRRGRVARNVCALIDPPSVVRVEVQPLTAANAKAILSAAKARRNAARWSVALALGLRQGEALGLMWKDIDLEAGSLTVRRALQRRPYQHGCDAAPCGRKRAAECPQRSAGGLVMVEPKSLAGRRTIALPAPLIAGLRAHRTAQLAERLLAGSMWQDRGLVFASECGAPIDASTDWARWKELLAAAGVRDARLHDARHTAATLLLTQKVPARVVMAILGHSQISLTLGTYSHVAPELAHEAAERMASALWGDAGASSEENGYHADTTDPNPSVGPSASVPRIPGPVRGAASGNRTPDNLITSEVLYRLS